MSGRPGEGAPISNPSNSVGGTVNPVKSNPEYAVPQFPTATVPQVSPSMDTIQKQSQNDNSGTSKIPPLMGLRPNVSSIPSLPPVQLQAHIPPVAKPMAPQALSPTKGMTGSVFR